MEIEKNVGEKIGVRALTFYEKIKEWAKSAGLRSVVYLAAGVGAFILLGSSLLLGVGIGIFCADNWVTIKELINKQIIDLDVK